MHHNAHVLDWYCSVEHLTKEFDITCQLFRKTALMGSAGNTDLLESYAELLKSYANGIRNAVIERSYK